MVQSFRRRPIAGIAISSILLLATLAIAPAAAAHAAFTAGTYAIEVGWSFEPTYVGQPNGVQVTIHDKDGKPVNDLGPDDLAVVVSTAGTDSPSLSFDPGFDPEEQEGPLGEYDASIVPTAPGDYTFHIIGTIHGAKVDITATSSADTFNAVIDSSAIEFPAKLPSLNEVATHLDRIDARIAALQSADPGAGGQTSAQDAANAAQAAAAAADRALLVGALLGGAGIVIGALGLWLALRNRRAGTGA